MKDKDISTIKQYETSRINPHNTECYRYFQQQELISQHISLDFRCIGADANRNFAIENDLNHANRRFDHETCTRACDFRCGPGCTGVLRGALVMCDVHLVVDHIYDVIRSQV